MSCIFSPLVGKKLNFKEPPHTHKEVSYRKRKKYNMYKCDYDNGKMMLRECHTVFPGHVNKINLEVQSKKYDLFNKSHKK